MTSLSRAAWIGSLLIAPLVLVGPAWAQTYTSGSTGAGGAFSPTVNTTLTLPPDGVFNFTTVTIPSNVTVTFARNAANTPVTILATGNLFVFGTLEVNGQGGATAPQVNLGGPGGFSGGVGGNPPAGGSGPGGGAPSGAGGNLHGAYGISTAFVSLLPPVGGSGGGGGIQDSFGFAQSGAGGGGGIVLASSTRIHVGGMIRANGGNGGQSGGGTAFASGAGSGGAIRLVAPRVTGAGLLQAQGGTSGLNNFPIAGPGRIRIESFTIEFTGNNPNPRPSFSVAPGPVTAASNPALVNLPTLSISAIGGVVAPPVPTGSYTTADVSLAPGTANPVTVDLAAANLPVGRVFTVKVVPQLLDPTTFTSNPTVGTFEAATTTADVNIPAGQVSQVLAFGQFTLPLVAGLLPFIDGEPVDRVMVAAAYGGPSTLSLITASGREIPATDLLPFQQAQLARAFALAQATSP